MRCIVTVNKSINMVIIICVNTIPGTMKANMIHILSEPLNHEGAKSFLSLIRNSVFTNSFIV